MEIDGNGRVEKSGRERGGRAAWKGAETRILIGVLFGISNCFKYQKSMPPGLHFWVIETVSLVHSGGIIAPVFFSHKLTLDCACRLWSDHSARTL